MSKNKINRIRKDNSQLATLIQKLRLANKAIWKKAAYELAKPRRMRVEVNLSKIELYAKDGGTMLVPGKVLGTGSISKKATIAAASFSENARSMIHNAGGRTISIEELFLTNPEGKDISVLT